MDQYVACEEPTAEDTRRNAQGDDALAGQVVSVAHDADEQARNLIGWRQTYDQPRGRPLCWHIDRAAARHDEAVSRIDEPPAAPVRCEVRGDAYWFGIPLVSDGTARVDARRIGPGALAFRPGNVELNW